jgi:nucleolar protein 12
MSLSSFLLGGKTTSNQKAIDTELDALFQTQVQDNGSTAAFNDKKRKPDGEQRHDLKKHKSAPKESQRYDSPPPKRVKLRENKKEKVDKRKLEAEEKLKAISAVESNSADHRGAELIDNSDSEEESGPSTLIHESLLSGGAKSSKRVSARKVKFAPPDESEEQRNLRTIFVGNLSSEVAQKRPLQKKLHRHILSLVPTAKIESTRFRSIAFQKPTSKLPDDDGKEQTGPRQHDRDRASSWRKAYPTADEPKNDEKKFLTPSQKKKVAFINHELHPSADSVNAYVVFAYPPPTKERPSNLPPLLPVMDPHEAARLAVEMCNGTVFMDRTIRVDSLGKPTDNIGKQSALLGTFTGDPKSSVFVGNLDFASKEEDLRIFFESLMTAERGPPSQASDAPKHWVSRVRIVRDKETQLGKGFAYVQFTDRVCVDETLAMEESKLKFAKRKLRVQRCKMLPKASATEKAAASKAATTSHSAGAAPPIDVPKGDPSLGEKIASLSKEERKQIKAADADRLARRMAKKKARMTLAKQGVPVRGKEKDGGRMRKTGAVKKAAIAPRKQSRIRSEKSMSKRNMKK